jgi:hypothetical protein
MTQRKTVSAPVSTWTDFSSEKQAEKSFFYLWTSVDVSVCTDVNYKTYTCTGGCTGFTCKSWFVRSWRGEHKLTFEESFTPSSSLLDVRQRQRPRTPD